MGASDIESLKKNYVGADGSIEDLPATQAHRPPSARTLQLKIAYVGASFAIVFLGFNVAQSFMTTLFPGSFGFAVLCVLYAVYGVSSLFVPSLNEIIGKVVAANRVEVISMTLGCILYLVFVFSVAITVSWFVIVAAVLSGLGAGLVSR